MRGLVPADVAADAGKTVPVAACIETLDDLPLDRAPDPADSLSSLAWHANCVSIEAGVNGLSPTDIFVLY